MRITKYSKNLTLTATTETHTSTGWINGGIVAVEYVKSTGTALSSTADLTISSTNTNNVILSSLAVGTGSWYKSVRATPVNTTNGAFTNESAYIPMADERFQITVSKATSTGQVGTFNVYVDGA